MLLAYLSYFLPIAVAIPLTFIAYQLPFYVSGVALTMFRADNRESNSIFYVAVLIASSIWFAVRPTPLRYIAFAFLAICAINAVAFVIMLLLRNKVREMERECGL